MSALSAISHVRPVAPAREPATGRFTPPGRLWSVQPVILQDGMRGWQVGPNGKIFARREHAESFALRRRNRFVAF